MKRVYFVRHGQSEGNVSPIYMDDSATLTEQGRTQAVMIAARAKELSLDGLITSSYPRAKETAEIISHEIGLTPIESNLFTERRGPSERIGKEKASNESKELMRQFLELATKPNSHFSDEESFDDMSVRADEAITFLDALETKNTLVVTHGVFLRFLMSRIIFGQSLTPELAQIFILALRMQNTGISSIYKRGGEDWRFWIWNDHAHLGELSSDISNTERLDYSSRISAVSK